MPEAIQTLFRTNFAILANDLVKRVLFYSSFESFLSQWLGSNSNYKSIDTNATVTCKVIVRLSCPAGPTVNPELPHRHTQNHYP